MARPQLADTPTRKYITDPKGKRRAHVLVACPICKESRLVQAAQVKMLTEWGRFSGNCLGCSRKLANKRVAA